VECRQRTRGGDWIWILSLGSIVQWDDEGKPLRMLGTHTDITERKQVESALAVTVEDLRVAEQRQRELLMVTRREQGRLRALLAAMNVGILFEDNQQHVEYLNPAFLRMWAIDETLDLVGQPMRKILEHSTHRLARPDHASRYVLQVLITLRDMYCRSWIPMKSASASRLISTMDVFSLKCRIRYWMPRTVC